jgi:hypothetical protein
MFPRRPEHAAPLGGREPAPEVDRRQHDPDGAGTACQAAEQSHIGILAYRS